MGQADAYPNLQLVLTRPIDWDLIRHHYDEMVKYATALRLGTAETEAILRRLGPSQSMPRVLARQTVAPRHARQSRQTAIVCAWLRCR
jgi:TnpA family transposase